MYVFPTITGPSTTWSAKDIAALVCTKMDVNDWRPVTAVSIALAESGGRPLAVSKLNWIPGAKAHLSVDLGLFQLNSYFNTVVNPYPDVPKIAWVDALDPFKNWEQTWKLINKGRTGWSYNWNGWTTFSSGVYKNFTTTALAGVNGYRATLGMGPLS